MLSGERLCLCRARRRLMSQAQRTEGACWLCRVLQRLSGTAVAMADTFFFCSHAPEAALEFPQHLRYTVSHEWAVQEPNGDVLVGISALAQDSLGELVYVELPAVGRTLSAGEPCAVVESTKAASDVYAPIAGEIVAVNESLKDTPQTVNEAPYEAGWLFRIRPAAGADLSALLSAEAYQAQAQ